MFRATHRLHPIDFAREELDEESCSCACGGKGWEVFNDDPAAGQLGEVQRCDDCRIFATEEEAHDAARFAGRLVALDGNLLPEPTGPWSNLEREMTLVPIVRARIAQDGRLLGTDLGTTYSVLGTRVYRDAGPWRLEYCGELADFERTLARGGLPFFRRA